MLSQLIWHESRNYSMVRKDLVSWKTVNVSVTMKAPQTPAVGFFYLLFVIADLLFGSLFYHLGQAFPAIDFNVLRHELLSRNRLCPHFRIVIPANNRVCGYLAGIPSQLF